MTQEEKDLLFKDLSARLLYGVMVSVQGGEFDSYKYPYQLTAVSKFGFDSLCKVYHPIYTPFGTPKIEDVKPYLRSMSSMTEEEKKYIADKCGFTTKGPIGGEFVLVMPVISTEWLTDFYNSHHIDWRGLIPMGLALEAKEGMYNN